MTDVQTFCFAIGSPFLARGALEAEQVHLVHEQELGGQVVLLVS